MAVKVKVEDLRQNISLGTKMPFLSEKAFIETNIALANVRIKYMDAVQSGEDELVLSPQEASAIIIHGITYAPSNSESVLPAVREVLNDIALEKKSSVIGTLPDNLQKYIEKSAPDANVVLSEEALDNQGLLKEAIENIQRRDFEVNESVRITEGPFANFTGVVEEYDMVHGTLKLNVSIFGRSTPVEILYTQVEKII